MKLRRRPRPIGKCKGCCLNLRTLCAAGLEPKAEWDHGPCRFWNDESLLERFLASKSPTGAEAARRTRRAKAASTKSVPHYDGVVFTPARQGSATK